MQLLGAVEAPLFALTARWPRRSLLAAGQLAAAATALLQAALVLAGPALPQSVPAAKDDEGEPAGEGGIRSAILWCAAGVLCTLMDEVLVSFGALHLEALGATPAQRGVALAAG